MADFALTIAAAATSGTASFTFTPTDNGLGEGAKAVTVSGTTAATGLAVTAAQLALADDDVASTGIALEVSPASVAEDAVATGVTVTATLDAGTRSTATTVTVSVGANGDSATAGTDYTAVADFALTIAAAATSGTASFTFTPTDDGLGEGDEKVGVSGATGSGLTVTSAELTLGDDEAVSTSVALAVLPVSVREDADATAVEVTATLDGGARSTATTVTVSVGADSDSATAGTDYTTVADFALTIAATAASGTASFTFTPTDDGLGEGDEKVGVSGTTTSGLTVTSTELTLADDETVSKKIALKVGPGSVREDAEATAVEVTATLDGGARSTATAVTVSVGANGDSATAGTDYTAVADFALTIAAAATSGTASFTFTPTDNGLGEGAKAVTVSGRTAVTELTVTATQLEVADDEAASTGIALTVRPTSVAEDAEAATVAVTATLDAGTRTAATTLTVSVGGSGDSATEGTDYTTVADFALTIAAAATSGTASFTFTPTDDGLGEGDEKVGVSGAAGSGLTVTSAELTLADDEAVSKKVTLAVSPTSVAEDAADTPVTVTARLDGGGRPAATTVTVSVGAPADSATSGDDYTSVSEFALTIAAAATSGTASFTFTPTDDGLGEGDKQVTVSGTTTSSGLTVESGQLALIDDDSLSTSVTLALEPATVAENAGATAVTVTGTLDGGAPTTAKTLTVSVGAVADSAVSGEDYTAVSAFALTIAAEATSGTASFTFTPTDDAVDEPDEDVEVGGASGAFTVVAAGLTLADDDATPSVRLALSPAAVAENGGASAVTATLSGASSESLTVSVAVLGSGRVATEGGDYAAVPALVLTIAANEVAGTATFTFTPTDDAVAEGGEVVAVVGATAGLSAEGVVLRIGDDDKAAARATLALAPAVVRESAAATPVTVTATLDGAAVATATTLVVTVGGGTGTATSGADYAAVSTLELTIAAAAVAGTATFDFTPTDDAVAEGRETVSVVGAAADGLAVEGTVLGIADDDGGTALALAVSPAAVRENAAGTAVTVTAVRDGSARATATVLTVAVSSLGPPEFAVTGARTLVVEAGETAATGTVTVMAAADDRDAPNEVATITASVSGGNGAGSPVPRLLTVVDDDTARLSLTPASVSVAPGDSVGEGYAVVLKTRPGGDVTVRADGAAAPGIAAEPATLTFTASNWQTAQTVRVTAAADADPGSAGTLVARAAGGGYELAPAVELAVWVAALPDPSIDDVEVSESSASADFRVDLGFAAHTRVTVGYRTADGTATGGTDYMAMSGTLTFDAGATEATISVPIISDTEEEDDETFTVTLQPPGNGMGRGQRGLRTASSTQHPPPDMQGTGTIRDDDNGDAVSGALRLGGGDLMDGDVALEGRVEIYYDGEWGTVCDDRWDDTDAGVACRQLGFLGAERSFRRSHFGGAAADVTIWLDDLECTGTESRLIDCPRNGQGMGVHDCSTNHTEDVGVRCVATSAEQGYLMFRVPDGTEHERTAALTVRAGATVVYSVRLSKEPELRDPPDRHVRMDMIVEEPSLGIRAWPAKSYWYSPDVNQGDWTEARELMVSVPPDVPAGTRTALVHTVVRSGFPTGQGEASDYPGEFRVTVTVAAADPEKTPGRVRDLVATVDGDDVMLEWSPPDDRPDRAVTSYRVESATGSSGDWEAQAATEADELHYRHVGALGSASKRRYRVAAVNDSGAGPYSNTATATRSAAGFAEGDLALVDGDVPWEGRVEVFQDGAWGRVCDDDWGLPDAEVACRQVGFAGALQAVGGSPFGTGPGETVLDDIDCTGDEFRLVDCARREKGIAGTHDCGETEDAGAVCRSPTGAAALPGLTDAIVDGARLALRFTEPLDAAFLPWPGDFAVLVSTPPDRTWREHPIATVSASARRLRIGLSAPVRGGDRVRLVQFVPGVHPLRGLESGAVLVFGEVNVRNATSANAETGVGDEAPPSSKPVRAPSLAAALADATPPSGVWSLESLDAAGRGIDDLGALQTLGGLHRLNLSGNRITDLSGVEALSGLRVLDLSDNAVVDLWPLSGLADLERLNLTRNRIVDPAALSQLTGLRVLILDGNAVAELSALYGLRDLAYLGVADNRVYDVGPLAQLSALMRLDISGNAVADVAPLRSLDRLVWLRLSGNRVSTLEPLGQLTRLRWVWAKDNPATDVRVLETGRAAGRTPWIDATTEPRH